MTATSLAPEASDAVPAAPAAAPAVAAVEVTRRFGGTVALDGVSLEVERGTIHALVGPNGAGKTTLLRLLTGLLDADGGSLRVLGVDPARSPLELRRRIGVVPSGTRSFYLRISGFENLVFFARLQGLSARDAKERARRALAAVDLVDAADRAVSAYSTGMHRRLAVARATVHEPELLLVDEATHDLDPVASARVRELVETAARGGASVLWATQRLEELRGFADRVTLLDRGRERFSGTVAQLQLFAQRRQYLVTLETDAPPPARIHELASLRDAGDGNYLLALEENVALGDAIVALADAGVRVVACADARPSLEQAFLALVGAED